MLVLNHLFLFSCCCFLALMTLFKSQALVPWGMSQWEGRGTREIPHIRDLMQYLFLCLTYFTQLNVFQVHPCCKWPNFIFFGEFPLYYGSEVTNPTSTHEDVGSSPGLAQWVKDLVLL